MRPMSNPPATTPVPAICLCFLAVVLLAAWNKVPLEDEGWFASPPYNLTHHGNFGTTTLDPRGYLLRPELTHIDRRTYWVLPLHLITQWVWYGFFGFGLLQLRMLSAVFGVVAIAALFRCAYRMTGELAGASLGALLMAQDNLFVWRSADGRMDVMCLGLGLAGLAAYLGRREQNLNRALLFGSSLVCLSLLTHPNGVIPLLWFL